MKFLFQIIRLAGFTFLYVLFLCVNPQKATSGSLKATTLSEGSFAVDLKVKLIGEIIGYSYIKMSIEPTDNAKRYKNIAVSLKGSYYEAISSKTYKIIGSFNTQTLLWKFDCFDKNTHTSVFIGKENSEGTIEGNWTSKKIIRRFYLKRSDEK